MSQAKLVRIFYIALSLAAMVLSGFASLSSLTGLAADVAVSSILCLVLWAMLGLILLFRPLCKSLEHNAMVMVLLFLGICLRLSLFDHISADYDTFLKEWVSTMRPLTVREALSTPIGDYNMPYLYLILLISRLPFSDLYLIKLFSVVADGFLALGVGYLMYFLTRKPTPVILGVVAVLFCPTFWLNSGYWGQCDSIYTVLAVWGLYFCLSSRPRRGMALFGLALSFKLQTIFVLPILAFLLVTNKAKLKDLLWFFGAFFASSVPALLGGRNLVDTFSIYFSQMESYPYLSLNAPSFWSLFHNGYYSDLSPATLIPAATAVLLIVFVFLKEYDKLSNENLIELALIFSVAIPWLLPKMHERYFFLAETLAILYAGMKPKRTPVALILLIGGFLIYCPYLFGEFPILSLRQVAVIYGILIIYLLKQLYQSVTIYRKEEL